MLVVWVEKVSQVFVYMCLLHNLYLYARHRVVVVHAYYLTFFF